jgi:hypothetical protein
MRCKPVMQITRRQQLHPREIWGDVHAGRFGLRGDGVGRHAQIVLQTLST